ncbi:MAG: DUF3800 domain-containing protein [bacterium]|nr:DUF3800 domain-containing protein [bacterium]
MTKLYYGFLDESGIIEEHAQKGNYFVITVVIVGNSSEIKHVIQKARHYGRGRFRFHRVFKASKEERGFVKLVLTELAKRDIGVVVGIFDKQQSAGRRDANVAYAELVGQTVALPLEQYPRLALTVHKRYTVPRIRQEMDRIVNQSVQEGTFLSIDHRTEMECRELELADAVAFALFQKYNNHDSTLYDIIAEKIQKENRLAA